jgi:hypothetical protein
MVKKPPIRHATPFLSQHSPAEEIAEPKSRDRHPPHQPRSAAPSPGSAAPARPLDRAVRIVAL